MKRSLAIFFNRSVCRAFNTSCLIYEGNVNYAIFFLPLLIQWHFWWPSSISAVTNECSVIQTMAWTIKQATGKAVNWSFPNHGIAPPKLSVLTPQRPFHYSTLSFFFNCKIILYLNNNKAKFNLKFLNLIPEELAWVT